MRLSTLVLSFALLVGCSAPSLLDGGTGGGSASGGGSTAGGGGSSATGGGATAGGGGGGSATGGGATAGGGGSAIGGGSTAAGGGGGATGGGATTGGGSATGGGPTGGGTASDGGFPHEPPGFVVLGEWNNEAMLDASGWTVDGVQTYGAKEYATSGYAGAPRIGGMAVIQTRYDGGVEGGHDPQRMQFSLPPGTRELFFGAELQFRGDYPTSTSSGGNKQLFVTFPASRYFVNLDEGAAQGRWGIYEQSTPLLNSNIDVVYGQWLTVEWYLRKDTDAGANDGVMRLWINGALAVERTDLTFPPGDMVLAYDDGSNNGNHYPLANSPRKIGTDLGGPVDAYRWTAVLRVSRPP